MMRRSVSNNHVSLEKYYKDIYTSVYVILYILYTEYSVVQFQRCVSRNREGTWGTKLDPRVAWESRRGAPAGSIMETGGYRTGSGRGRGGGGRGGW